MEMYACQRLHTEMMLTALNLSSYCCSPARREYLSLLPDPWVSRQALYRRSGEAPVQVQVCGMLPHGLPQLTASLSKASGRKSAPRIVRASCVLRWALEQIRKKAGAKPSPGSIRKKACLRICLNGGCSIFRTSDLLLV